ncbi:glycerophosphodiester phosphodiesterase [Euhalothece natronophila]|uniref:glycerophosphodiester phosphodiesterase n=1 Tax=Euhalothece natronophila TaxID=577489 RepID=UPI001C99080A|nr:glycerophosphodiester phosphodiesterase family protein [Euhalothece natronophila]
MIHYQLIAHRGYSAVAPENTLASFRAAIEQKVWGVEFDIHPSVEGVPIVIHDHTLDRTTNQTGKVRDQTVSQLQSLDAGTWFNSQFASETLPTLQEVVNLFAPTSICLLIEVKTPSHWSSQAINNLIQILESMRDRCLILCFDHEFLHYLQQVSPRFACGYGVKNITYYSLDYVTTLSSTFPVILPHFSLITENPLTTQYLMEAGYELIPWTVDESSIALQLFKQGIVKIITNNLLKS